jgi:hypothetical protein
MIGADWPWGCVALSVAVAIGAGVADWRSKRRDDLDRIGMVYWPTIQVAALIVAAVLGAILLHS